EPQQQQRVPDCQYDDRQSFRDQGPGGRAFFRPGPIMMIKAGALRLARRSLISRRSSLRSSTKANVSPGTAGGMASLPSGVIGFIRRQPDRGIQKPLLQITYTND